MYIGLNAGVGVCKPRPGGCFRRRAVHFKFVGAGNTPDADAVAGEPNPLHAVGIERQRIVNRHGDRRLGRGRRDAGTRIFVYG